MTHSFTHECEEMYRIIAGRPRRDKRLGRQYQIRSVLCARRNFENKKDETKRADSQVIRFITSAANAICMKGRLNLKSNCLQFASTIIIGDHLSASSCDATPAARRWNALSCTIAMCDWRKKRINDKMHGEKVVFTVTGIRQLILSFPNSNPFQKIFLANTFRFRLRSENIIFIFLLIYFCGILYCTRRD